MTLKLQSETEPAMEIQASEYEAIANQIHSDDSPVGIDAKKTHILIIHMLQQIQHRIGKIEERIEDLEGMMGDRQGS